MEYFKSDARILLEYIKCAEGVRKFRNTHFNFVHEYIIKKEKITVGTAGSDPLLFLPNNIFAVKF